MIKSKFIIYIFLFAFGMFTLGYAVTKEWFS